MREDGLKILVYEIPFMLQWGTPEDLKEYLYWSEYFTKETNKQTNNIQSAMNVLVPMAGFGSRFSKEDYKLPKLLIEVDNTPMFVKATESLPVGEKYIFVVRKEHLEAQNLNSIIYKTFPNSHIITANSLTQGQACSALLAKKFINNPTPLLIGACDNGLIFNMEQFMSFTSPSSEIDALVFTFRNNLTVNRNPAMYGWVKTDKGHKALEVSVKVPISSCPANDHAIVGTFWFKKGEYFVKHAEEMIKANDMINNEFYIDTCMNYLIKNNLNVHVFEVDKYICWGTPGDLKTYQYWQRYFTSLNTKQQAY